MPRIVRGRGADDLLRSTLASEQAVPAVPAPPSHPSLPPLPPSLRAGPPFMGARGAAPAVRPPERIGASRAARVAMAFSADRAHPPRPRPASQLAVRRQRSPPRSEPNCGAPPTWRRERPSAAKACATKGVRLVSLRARSALAQGAARARTPRSPEAKRPSRASRAIPEQQSRSLRPLCGRAPTRVASRLATHGIDRLRSRVTPDAAVACGSPAFPS